MLCPDGSTCVSQLGECSGQPAACPANNSCGECPDDTAVYACRYKNGFDNGNEACIDFPAVHGWSAESAMQECSAIPGVAEPVVSSAPGNSCLVRFGGIEGTTRCTFTGSLGSYFAYEIPAIGCGFGGGVFEQNGPYCLVYQ